MTRVELLRTAKPILFNTEMVRAILSGRKTQTRRVVKAKPPYSQKQLCERENYRSAEEVEQLAKSGRIASVGFWTPYSGYVTHREPAYQIGDILYVRETWRVGAWDEHTGSIAVDYKADNQAREEWIKVAGDEIFERYWIQSTNDAINAGLQYNENGQYHWEPGKGPTRWRPSIHMPKTAARLFLKVTDVGVERLQDITEADAKAEGIKSYFTHKEHGGEWHESNSVLVGTDNTYSTRKKAFAELWDSTIKTQALDLYSWKANPWVWVYEFERMSV